jgi:uncharacterized protein
MKIAIISDSHDNLTNIQKFVKVAKKEKFDEIIHCGDMCIPKILGMLAETNAVVHFTFGNIDPGAAYEIMNVSANNKKINIYKPFGEIDVDGKKIAFVHYPKLAHGLACTKNYNAVFHGHNHTKKAEKVRDCWLANPGEIAGFVGKPTYAVYDTKKDTVEIKNL